MNSQPKQLSTLSGTLQAVEARWRARLDRRIIDHLAPAVAEWTPLLHQLAPAADRDPYLPVLAHRLAQISGVGLDAHRLLRAATNEGQLPDDHAASALWWRICRHLTPAVATQLADQHHTVTASWLADLEQNVGPERTAALQASPWWPALVVTVEQALARGWQLTDLISTPEGAVDIDDCQALVWRTSVLLAPSPTATTCLPTPPMPPRTSTGRRTPTWITQQARQRRTTRSTGSNRTWSSLSRPSNAG